MRASWLRILFLLSVGTASSAFAAEDAASMFRPCVEADLIGTWRLENMEEKPIGDETDIFEHQMPFQYIHFAQGGRYLFAMSNAEYKEEKNITALLKLASDQLQLYFSADQKGVLVIKDSKKVTDQASCNIALKTAGKFIKDGLVLSQGRQKPVPTQTTRIYRRLFKQ